MQSIPEDAAAVDNCTPILRTLETRLVQCEEDGGEYARQVLDMLRRVDEVTNSGQVLKGIIHVIMTDIRRPRTFSKFTAAQRAPHNAHPEQKTRNFCPIASPPSSPCCRSRRWL